jgi:hypothetical protein
MSKSLRQFQCRDDLWARVEALADRRGMSTDDVVQAALVQLFSRKKRTSESQPAAGAPESSPPPRVTREPATSLPRSGNNGGPRLPPPSPRTTGPNATASAGSRPLYLYFEGQCYEVDQDQFVIGRGSKYSDLAIKDANISRRHCAIVRRNGQYYIKDLESTNGVEYNGQRVDNHLIQEGTTYKLCDHEIRFSFIPPA